MPGKESETKSVWGSRDHALQYGVNKNFVEAFVKDSTAFSGTWYIKIVLYVDINRNKRLKIL